MNEMQLIEWEGHMFLASIIAYTIIGYPLLKWILFPHPNNPCHKFPELLSFFLLCNFFSFEAKSLKNLKNIFFSVMLILDEMNETMLGLGVRVQLIGINSVNYGSIDTENWGRFGV